MMHLSRKWSAVALSGLTAIALGSLGPSESLANAPATASSDAGAQPAALETSAAPDNIPPSLEVIKDSPGTAEGLLFYAPHPLNPESQTPRGPQIVDDQGRPVWYHQIPDGMYASDFRVQTYQGEPVLTWWEGESDQTGNGRGTGYIANENYEIIATVQTPDEGEKLDLHEFTLTPEGTALVVSYQEVPYDLTPIGGPQDGKVIESVVQEIDVETGEALLDWRSLDHVGIDESDAGGGDPTRPIDYLHVNSVSLDTDGNLLISGRHSSTIYKVDRETGEIIWRLGGRNSDFRLGVGVRFQSQHDVHGLGDGVYRIFDNATAGHLVGYESRVVWIKIDEESGTASYLRQLTHPELMSVVAEGGAQQLPNGNTLVNWGFEGRVSEFSPRGELLYDADISGDASSYRTYRYEWEGEPVTKPDVTVDTAADDVHAIWNGATDVAEWRVLGGDSEEQLRPVARVTWKGLETSVPMSEPVLEGLEYVQVEALDDRGQVIGVSPVEPVGAADAAEDGRTS
jgi:hypothetical protein